jgi:hypothetical protein
MKVTSKITEKGVKEKVDFISRLVCMLLQTDQIINTETDTTLALMV